MQEVIIFDSGVGGFSILQAVLALNLGYSITYLADQANFPYGDRSAVWLTSRLKKIATWVESRSPLALVLACNTASVTAIQVVRALVSCPVIGVEPVIKPLAKYSHPLVLATHASLSSTRNHELIDNYNPTILSACPSGLVQAIEEMDEGGIRSSLRSLEKIIIDNQVDALGLSCTHYPLVKGHIHELYPQVTLFDPSSSVAKHLASFLPASPSPRQELHFLTTKDPTKLTTQVQYYLHMNIRAKAVKL